MKNKFILIFCITILLLSVSTLAKKQINDTFIDSENLTVDEIIKKNSFKLKHNDKSDQLFYKEIKKNGDFYDLEIYTNSSRVKLKKIKNIDDVKYISIHKNKSLTRADIIDIQGIELESAEIILSKNHGDNNLSIMTGILYSVDGFNYEPISSIEYEQNATHFWFNTTHFSSFTGTINDIVLIQDWPYAPFYQDETIDITDYATIDDPITDYGAVQYHNGTSSPDFDEYSEKDSDTFRYAFDEVDDITYKIEWPSYMTFTLTGNSAWANYLDTSFNVIIRNGDDSLDAFQQVDVRTRSFQYADADQPYAPTEYEEVPYVRFFGKCDFNDETGTVTGKFQYRVQGAGSWDITTGQSVSDLTFFGEDSPTLTYATYEYRTVCVTSLNTYVSSTATFTLTAPSVPEPTVETLSALTGDRSAYLRALVDYDGFGGSLFLAFNVTNETQTNRLPSVGWYSPTDGVIYTSDQIVNLTNGYQHSYYAFIYNGSDYTYGDTLFFTPNAPTGGGGTGGLYEDLEAYYSFDDADLNASSDPLDLTDNNNDGVNNGASTSASGILGEAFDFETTESDYVQVTDSTSLNITGDMSICAWVKPESTTTGGIASKRDGDSTNYQFYYSSSNYRVYDGTNDRAGSTTIDAGDWSFICYTVDSGTITFYLNGSSDGSNSISITAGATDLYIGEESANNFHFDGLIDELGIWSRALSSDDISELFNDGAGLPFSQFGDAGTYTVETLSVTNTTYKDTVFRGIPYITGNVSLNGFEGNFNYRINGTSTWFNMSTEGITNLTNNTIYSWDTSSYFLLGQDIDLDDNTTYEYQAYIINITNQIVYYGNLSYFTTSLRPSPDVELLSPLNVTNQSFYFRINITETYGWNITKIFLATKPGNESEYQISNITASFYGLDSFNGSQLYDGTKTTLYPETSYITFAGVYYNSDNTSNSSFQYLETSETGGPILNTEPAENILRDQANLVCDLVDLGIYDNITIYFRYENSTDNYTTDQIPYYTEVELSDTVYNLSINTTYTYECIGIYDNGNRNRTGGEVEFTTLSLGDFIEPDILGYVFDSDIYFNSVTLQYSLTIYDNLLNFTTLNIYYYIYDSDGNLVNQSGAIPKNVSGVYEYTFNYLESYTNYIYEPRLFYTYNGSNTLIYGANTTFRTLDITESPKSVNVFGNWNIYIDDPYFFSLIFIISIAFFGFSFTIPAIKSHPGIVRFVIYALTGVTVGYIIWAYSQQILSTFQITLHLSGVLIIGFYYFLQSTRGNLYG